MDALLPRAQPIQPLLLPTDAYHAAQTFVMAALQMSAANGGTLPPQLLSLSPYRYGSCKGAETSLVCQGRLHACGGRGLVAALPGSSPRANRPPPPLGICSSTPRRRGAPAGRTWRSCSPWDEAHSGRLP